MQLMYWLIDFNAILTLKLQESRANQFKVRRLNEKKVGVLILLRELWFA